jgi:hypothetical protein
MTGFSDIFFYNSLNHNRLLGCVRFEIFTAVTMKNAVFWDVALCRSCVNRRLGETYRLHLQCRKICERGTSHTDFCSLKLEAILSSETSVYTTSQKTAFFNYRVTANLSTSQVTRTGLDPLHSPSHYDWTTYIVSRRIHRKHILYC